MLRPLSAWLAVGLACLAGAGPAPAGPVVKPRHIMSMNLCTDLLLLQMVDRSRIASVTHLAHAEAEALFPGADRGVAINHGAAEDIINQKPDMVLVGDFATPVTRKLAARVGIPIAVIASADSFADTRTAIRQVGAAVGEPVRAEALIRRMDASLARLAATRPARRYRVIAWSGGAFVPGRGTLTDAIIEAAGAQNIAAGAGYSAGAFDVERLLQARPDALLYGKGDDRAPSLHGDEGQHRLVRVLYGDRRIAYNEVSHGCGLPQSAEAAVSLRAALLALPNRKASY